MGIQRAEWEWSMGAHEYHSGPEETLPSDLPVWEWPEGIEDLKWTGVCYFDGEHCYEYIYYYYFCSFAPDGKRQIWPVKSDSADFMVLDSYVRINGEINDELVGNDQSEEVFYSYFPASHGFRGVSKKANSIIGE